MIGEHRDVFNALAQRRDHDPDDIDAVEEVPAKSTSGYLGGERAVRGGDETPVDLPSEVLPDTSDLALLNRAEELGLCPCRQ